MKNRIFRVWVIFAAISFFFIESACGYWIWTPGSKKFVNPKYAVKDTPKAQFKVAMRFFEARDYKRAADEFERLVKHYELAEEASEAQYYLGLSYENQEKYYLAFQNYQKVVENYPHSKRLEEIIEREYKIGDIYLNKPNPKLMGSDLMAPIDRAIEILKKVVENAPYGRCSDGAQFKLGIAYRKAEMYEESIMAFQKVVDEYPSSSLAEKARYEVALSAYQASLKPAYDSAATEKAIETFKDFVDTNKNEDLVKNAEGTLNRLVDNMAEKDITIAKFYESQKRYASALVYYREALEKYPESSHANALRDKIAELERKLEKKK